MNSGGIRLALNDAAAVNWAEFHPVAALCCLPAIAILLGAGLILGWPQAALAATSGALIAGFGFFQQVSNRRGSVMLLVVTGMSLSAAIGTLVNVSWTLETACIALWGFAMGLATLVSLPLSWVVMQCAIALIVSAAIPAGLGDAIYRALLIGAGGLLQTILMEIVVFCFPRLEQVVNRPGAEVGALRTRLLLDAVREAFAWHAAGLRFPCILAFASALGNVLYRVAAIPDGWWVPMTMLLVMRPAVRETGSRTIGRIGGTIVGACAVTLLLAVMRPSHMVMAAMIVVTVWGCFASQRVNYALLTVCVTGYVALLFAYAGLPEPDVALYRLVATVLGGVLAVVIHRCLLWLWYRWMGPDQNGDSGPLVIAATSARQTNEPSAAAQKPSM
ncbi:MAG TPA: FUSC family protein [Rhodopila sp.]|nr:FUSC family protein [Rhodopila sp.]